MNVVITRLVMVRWLSRCCEKNRLRVIIQNDYEIRVHIFLIGSLIVLIYSPKANRALRI